jgi:hypothetical protein
MCPHCYGDDCEDETGYCPVDPQHPANREAPAAADVADCDCGPVPGAVLGMNDRDQIQRCDDCARYTSDEQAANAVAAAAGVSAELVGPAGDGYWVVKARALASLLPLTAEEIRARVAARQGLSSRTYRTKTGRVLTGADIQALADEAERGYPVEQIRQGLPAETPEHLMEGVPEDSPYQDDIEGLPDFRDRYRRPEPVRPGPELERELRAAGEAAAAGRQVGAGPLEREDIGGRWGIGGNTARLVAAELRRLADVAPTPEQLRARADLLERTWSRS